MNAIHDEGAVFMADGRHVVLTINFAGAPAPPQASSSYQGAQVIVVKTDGTTFANGDPWKCVTCGVPAANAAGMNPLDRPEAFHDGKRVRAGANVIDCSPLLVTDEACTPERTHIYPIRWNVKPDGSGAGGSMRELFLHPDNVHLGWSSVVVSREGLGQFAYLGRLEFNPAPTAGTPLVPRYELANVTRFFSEAPETHAFREDPDNPGELLFNPHAPGFGELRGFTSDGQEAFFNGSSAESGHFDLYATHLSTGKSRRLSRHPGFTDSGDMSPDDKWIAVMDNRASERMMFVAGMRGIPSITDLVTSTAVASIRNNGQRRFFQPWLIDRYGDRGSRSSQRPVAVGRTRCHAPSAPNQAADGPG